MSTIGLNLTRAAMTCFVVILLTSCGARDTLPVASAGGTVAIETQPLADATIIFTPTRGRSASGQTDKDGRFKLSTYAPGDGAIIGLHQVSIVAREPGEKNMPGVPLGEVPGRSLIPEKYGSTATSGLTFEILPDAENNFQITLERR